MSDLFSQSVPPMTVSQLTDIIKELLEGSLPQVFIEAEISNCRPSSTGHLYLTLKDSNAAISAVMFKGKSHSLSFIPKDGMMVQVTGSISVYPPRGSYQIVIDKMEQAGQGDILQLLEERKKKLASEGLFDSANKKPLPFFPNVIGVVTSPTGAALRDILQITQRRNNTISVVVLPCPVQGSEAAELIATQIQTANAYNLCDVLIIGRGGGSLEDLLPFSEECVVRAVAASHIPIVSAVGHEIDWALSDYAADVRAPTPSAAAELVTPLKDDLLDQLSTFTSDLHQSVENLVQKARLVVKSFSIDSMELRFRSIEQPFLMRFDDAKEQLIQNIADKVEDNRKQIKDCVRELEAANPSAILDRGFSMVRDTSSGKIIRSSSDVKIGSKLDIIPASGHICAIVDDITQ